MASQQQIREQITQSIIDAIESGNVPPWRRPWRLGPNAGAHANVVSQRSYRGLNPILLDLASQTHDFSSRWWATFHQWRRMGGRVTPRPSHVPPGRWGTRICYWMPVTKTGRDESGEEVEDSFILLRLYTVFNVDQGEGLDHLRTGQPDADEQVIDYRPAEEALEAARVGMGVGLRYGGGEAYYSPVEDFIRLPPRATFESPAEFYGTAFHELVHATEHRSRLDWSRKDRQNAYALGELIAELGGVFACRELGVPATEDLSNHTAYLASWLTAMKNDSRFIITASAQASKAATYILGFSRKPEHVPEEEGELVAV
jgi:antirestriction protein ArdC